MAQGPHCRSGEMMGRRTGRSRRGTSAAGIRDRYDGTLRQQFGADTELIDEICAEGERFSKQLK